MNHFLLKTLLFWIFFFQISTAYTQVVKPNICYKVIGIADGDTFTVLDEKIKRPITIRMEAIDAPEKGMPYWKKSKQFLSNIIFGQCVYLKYAKLDHHQRWVARAYTQAGVDISAEMLKSGYAWHFKKYNTETNLSKIESEARKKKWGLWADKNPLNPADVRQMHRKGISTKILFQNSVK